MFRAALLALSSLIVGCATHFSTAQEAARRGDYQTAHDNYLACAQQGNAGCMNNLGVMFAQRQVRDANPREKAVFWFTLAARHGSTTAGANLTSWGLPVPPADLVRQKSPQEIQAEMEAAEAFGEAIGALIGAAAARRR